MAPQQPSAAARERANQQNLRNQLFEGADPDGRGASDTVASSAVAPTAAEPTIQQLVSTVVSTHKETTNVANRALRAVEQTRELQGNTMVALEKQGRQLSNIDRNFTTLNVDLSYSEKLLNYMRRCCCCCLFDKCTGADPEEELKRKWRKRAQGGETDAKANGLTTKDPYTNLAMAAAAAKGKVPPKPVAAVPAEGEEPGVDRGPCYRNPDIRLVEGMEATEMQLHEETRKQNEVLDKIHEGLQDIMRGAEAMTSELTRQNAKMDHVDTRAENTAGRIIEMNTKSQLGEYRTKVKENPHNSMSLQKVILKHALDYKG